MCGYDLTKTIHGEYHALLSRGTVYPLLYVLRDKGFLSVMSKNSEKVYNLTDKGREREERKIKVSRGHRHAWQVLREKFRFLKHISEQQSMLILIKNAF